MKIKFFSDYDTSAVLLDRFRANYHVYDQELQFTTQDDYEYAVAFNRMDEPLKRGAKLITIVQEPSFSEAFAQGDTLVKSDYLLVHDRQLFERTWGISFKGIVVETPSYMFYHDWLHRSFYTQPSKILKDRKLSIILSSHHFTRGNYLKRIKVLQQILDSDLDIDIYGRGWNIPDDRYKGELEYKATGLLRYEYSIAMENTNEKNYITEKFVDCVLCDAVPIYNGAPNVAEVYNPEYFRTIDINRNDVVDQVRAIIKDPAPVAGFNKKVYLEKMNLYARLKNIILNEPLPQ